MSATAITQPESNHYDRHSRQLSIDQCSFAECRAAAPQIRRSLFDELANRHWRIFTRSEAQRLTVAQLRAALNSLDTGDERGFTEALS